MNFHKVIATITWTKKDNATSARAVLSPLHVLSTALTSRIPNVSVFLKMNTFIV